MLYLCVIAIGGTNVLLMIETIIFCQLCLFAIYNTVDDPQHEHLHKHVTSLALPDFNMVSFHRLLRNIWIQLFPAGGGFQACFTKPDLQSLMLVYSKSHKTGRCFCPKLNTN